MLNLIALAAPLFLHPIDATRWPSGDTRSKPFSAVKPRTSTRLCGHQQHRALWLRLSPMITSHRRLREYEYSLSNCLVHPPMQGTPKTASPPLTEPESPNLLSRSPRKPASRTRQLQKAPQPIYPAISRVPGFPPGESTYWSDAHFAESPP